MTIEDYYYIHINDLKGHVDFNSNEFQSGLIEIGDGCSFGYSFSNDLLIIKYMHRGNLNQNFINIVYTDSNLNLGRIPFFQCPDTGKRVCKMYVDQYSLVSRHSLRLMYDSQAETKRRGLYGYIQKVFKLDAKKSALIDELERPYFKSSYAGVPTKRLTRIASQLDRIRSAAPPPM